MLTLLVGLALGLAAYEWWRWRVPDSQTAREDHSEEYDAVALGDAAPTPFRLRWLLPRLLGTRTRRWRWFNRVCMILSVPTLGFLASAFGLSFWAGLAVMSAWSVFPSYWEYGRRFPKAMEPFNMVVLMAAVIAFLSDYPIIGVALSFLAGATRETSPLVIAGMTLSPWPLLGILGCGWWRKSCEPWRREHLHGSPWKLFKEHGLFKLREGIPFDWLIKLGPATLGIASLSPRVWLPLAFSISTMLVASDKVRLLLPAVPILLISAVSLLPVQAYPIFFVVALACSNTWESCGGAK